MSGHTSLEIHHVCEWAAGLVLVQHIRQHLLNIPTILKDQVPGQVCIWQLVNICKNEKLYVS